MPHGTPSSSSRPQEVQRHLLDDDGSASMATAFMMSHHGFRRDLARFARALEAVAKGDRSRADALREEWKSFRDTLHGHHQVEDAAMFPSMRTEHPHLAPTIDQLGAEHRRIDPLLERGDRAFAELSEPQDAAAVVTEIGALLDTHLAVEEAELVPFLRDAKAFPTPGSDEEAEMYAKGFAWASHGVAADILEKVDGMLPEIVTSRLPAAREGFAERCRRVWGTAEAGASRTSIPDR